MDSVASVSLFSLTLLVLTAVLWVIYTRAAIRDLSGRGARRAAYVIVIATLTVCAVVLNVLAIPLPLRLLSLVVAYLVLYASKEIVQWTGGPMTEWALLRERWAISRQIEDLPEPIPAEQLRAVHDRIRGLERFRTPKTAEYIDLVRLILMDQTPNDRARVDAAADRLMELEREWVKKARLPVKLVRRDKV